MIRKKAADVVYIKGTILNLKKGLKKRRVKNKRKDKNQEK